MVTLRDYSLWRVSPHPQLWWECVWSISCDTSKWVWWQHLHLFPERALTVMKFHTTSKSFPLQWVCCLEKTEYLLKPQKGEKHKVKRRIKKKNWEGKHLWEFKAQRGHSHLSRIYTAVPWPLPSICRGPTYSSLIQCPNTGLFLEGECSFDGRPRWGTFLILKTQIKNQARLHAQHHVALV